MGAPASGKVSALERGAMNKLLLVILAIILPPAAVAAKSGISQQFWINLILTLIFWIPGVIHALIVVV